jgi:hypothetical protein
VSQRTITKPFKIKARICLWVDVEFELSEQNTLVEVAEMAQATAVGAVSHALLNARTLKGASVEGTPRILALSVEGPDWRIK